MRIMLACAMGMSTSILVQKMKDTAKKQGKEYKIWAVDLSQIEHEKGNFDVVMLGPQVMGSLRKIRKIVGDEAPVEVIDMASYGRIDGSAVLKQAENIIKEKQNEG